jgi:hypothetical protein
MTAKAGASRYFWSAFSAVKAGSINDRRGIKDGGRPMKENFSAFPHHHCNKILKVRLIIIGDQANVCFSYCTNLKAAAGIDNVARLKRNHDGITRAIVVHR